MAISRVGLLSFIWGKLGVCAYCMHKALLIAFSSWCLVAVVKLFSGNAFLLVPCCVVAMGLTMLWLTHFIAFSIRLYWAFKKGLIEPPTAGLPAVLSRRAVFPMFAQAMAITAFASVVRPIPAKSQQSQDFLPTAKPYLATHKHKVKPHYISQCGGNNNVGYCPTYCYRVIDDLCYLCHSCTTASYTCGDSYPGGGC